MSTTVAEARKAPRRASLRERTREGRYAFLLLIPSAVVVFGIVVYPIIKTLITSFYAVKSPFPGDYPGVGVRNYTTALHQGEFWSSVLRTLYFTAVSTTLEVLFGLGIALLLNAPLRM